MPTAGLPGAATAKVDAPARMLTVGQVNSLSTAGGGASPTACDFEPNSWPNLSLIDGLESDEAPNMLPPPHPDKAPATANASATRRRPARPAAIVRIISLLRFIRLSSGTYRHSLRVKGARFRAL